MAHPFSSALKLFLASVGHSSRYELASNHNTKTIPVPHSEELRE